MMRLADGRYSPMLAAMRCFSLVLSFTFLTTGYSKSRKMRVSAPESLIWYSSSRSLYSGLTAVVIAPALRAP